MFVLEAGPFLMAGAPPTCPSTPVSSRASRVVVQLINTQKVVCPSREELEVETGGHVCPSEGCGRVFQASSHLQMHLTRHHDGEKLGAGGNSSTDCVFYCPVEGCSRSREKENPFPRLGQLKQHYHTVHGRKEYVCQKCGKRFGLRDVCSRHEAECGSTFSCETCGETFRTKNAHYKHAVRKKHTLPSGSKPRKTKMKMSSLKNSTALKPPTIVVRNVIQLPKRVSQTGLSGVPRPFPQTQSKAVQVDLSPSVLSSSFAQTNESFLSTLLGHDGSGGHQSTATESVSISVGTGPIPEILQSEEGCQFDLELSDLATQTEGYYSPSPHFNLSNFATQTDDIPFLTCTDDGSSFSFTDLGTQTTEEDISRVLNGNRVERYGIMEESQSVANISTTSTLSSSHSQGIQTLPQMTNEFGTQTLHHFLRSDFPHYDTPTSNPQQLSGNCCDGNELHHHHHHHGYHHHQHQQEFCGESHVDFGTQTSLRFPLTCSNVNDFGTQTINDKELSDLVDELSSEGLQHILPPECMDFGTQTRESEFSGIEYLDFGVQTSFGLHFSAVLQDQGSQTQD